MRTSWIAAAAAASLIGCAAQQAVQRAETPVVRDTIVLLPDAEGRSGTVVVKAPGGEKVLTRPYETAEVTAKGEIGTRVLDESEVRRRFGEVLAARPPLPVSFTLYFLEGRDEIAPESMAVLEKVKATLAGWPAPEISVIGHTDTSGDAAANDRLSLQRAEVVKKALLGIGIEESRIETVGRGERELLVPTADEVKEPRNRRVEISIR